MSLRRLLRVVVCAPCVFGATGWAQVAGRISGSVVDATGAAVKGNQTGRRWEGTERCRRNRLEMS